MDKIEYLNKALQAGCYIYKAWIVTCVAATNSTETAESLKDTAYDYYLLQNDTGYWYWLDDKLNKITGVKKGEPLIKFLDRFVATTETNINLKQSIESTFGSVLFNTTCITHNFGKNFPYMKGMLSVSDIEELLPSYLIDDLEGNRKDFPETDKIYIHDYLGFMRSLTYFEGLAMLANVSATPKNIMPPPGLKEYKAQLLEEYGDSINDPVIVGEFESKLSAFQDEWLKDDPSAGRFLTPKIKNSMKKMQLTGGYETGFGTEGEQVFIPNSLAEGWSDDPETFAGGMNSLRSASYFRGQMTQVSGVMAKTLLRGSSTYRVTETDCGTTKGLTRAIKAHNLNSIINRSIMINDKWVLISKEDAKKYIGTTVTVRSPMYCVNPSDTTLCIGCMGKGYTDKPDGIANSVAAIGAIIMGTMLKKMHNTNLEIGKVSIFEHLR